MVDLQILVPLHNKGAYVREALDSILRQQTTYTFEVLIADDASQDDGPTIADEYARHHSAQFKIFRHSVNIGCLANTVSLYEKISARYFTVLDPDDFWIDDRHIETALNFLENNPEFTLFLSNTWLEKNGERSKMYSVQSQVVEFFPLDRIVLGHTSATFFRAQESFARVLPVLKSHVGMCTERAYEGDTFRVLFYLSEGKGYFSNDVRSVYRYTNQGI